MTSPLRPTCIPLHLNLENLKNLKKHKDVENPASLTPYGICLGTAGFEYTDWVGCFYPSNQGWFQFYQQYFSFLEIGHTYYQMPQLMIFLELERKSKSSMRFSVKVHGDISHKALWNLEQGKALMKQHVEAVSPISETGKFYSFLIQLDHGLERKRQVLDYLLYTASVAIDQGMDVHVEFRNRTWHQESVLQSLKNSGIGICNTEIPNLAEAFPLKTYATSAKGYLRYHGLNLDPWQRGENGTSLSPNERQKRIQSRSDYLYTEKELVERREGQLALMKKVDLTALVFTNHISAQAVANALQAQWLLHESLGLSQKNELRKV